MNRTPVKRVQGAHGIAALWRDALVWLPAAMIVLIACLCVHLLKETGLFTGAAPLRHGALLAAIVLVFIPVRARDVATPLLILHRTLVVLFAGFALVSYPTLTQAYYDESNWTALLMGPGRWIAVAAGVLGWWRPGFGLVTALYAGWKKEWLEELYGFGLNATDYYVVMELAIFVCLAIGVVALAERIATRRGRDWTAQGWSLGEAAFLAALSLHLANYFYSAVAKMTLPGAGPFTWILENETAYIAAATAVTGLGPLATDPGVTGWTLSFLEEIQIVSNLMTLGLQLAAILAVVRIRWAIAATLAYDALHLGIFLTTGILFWKWMAVNAGLVLALGTLRDRRAPPWPGVVMALGVLILSPQIFRIAHLGWFDTRALNRPSVEAVLEDGRIVPVPSNYFLEGATQLAKASIGAPFPGHFDRIGVFGKALDGAQGMRRAKRCDLPVDDTRELSESFDADPRLERFFRRHHDYMLAQAGVDGQVAYNFFPHHNWSNPMRFAAFRDVDLRDIVAYRYIIDSICLAIGESGVEETLMRRGQHVIDLR